MAYRFCFITLFLLLNCNPVYAQNSGELAGFVRDARSGEPLPGATVQLEETMMGAAADSNGYYRIDNIPPKTYRVTARFIGYRPETRFNVVIRSGGNPDLNFSLEPATRELEGITVVPDPFRNPPETPLSTQELSRVEIASYPGGNNDIAKVVQSLPGVSGSIGGFRNDVIIRGGAPSENVYYLDGIEIPIINHFATQGSGGGPVGLLNVSFFEGVSLSTSSFHARYDNVLSGVLQFDQRSGSGSDYRGNLRVGASEAGITLEGPLVRKKENEYSNTTFIASFRRSYLQFLFQLIDLPFLPDYWDYQYKINHKPNEYNEFSLTSVGSVDDFSINEPDDFDAEQQAILEQVPIINQWSNTAGASWKRRFKQSEGFVLTALRTTVFNNRVTRFENNVEKTGPVERTESREWLNTLRSEYNRFLGNYTYSGGVMAEVNSFQTERLVDPENLQFDSSLDFFRYGFFSQITGEWMNGRLSFSAGFRMDGNSFTNNGNRLWETFSPRGAVSYGLTRGNRWELNASAGRYYKLLPSTVLVFQDDNGNFSNRDKGYIRNDHFVLGIAYQPDVSARVTLEGFYKRYNDYPVSVRDSVSLANLGGDFENFGNEQVRSNGRGRTFGAELAYQQKLAKNFYGILAYTLFWSEFTGFDPGRFLPSSWDNRHLLTFTGGYKLPANWELGARLRIQGGTPFPSLDREETLETYPILEFDYSGLERNRLDLFNSLDIRIDKKWNYEKWSFNLFLDVQNVYGAEVPDLPTYGLRRDEAGNVINPREITEIEDVDNSSIIPTIGIVVDI